MCLRCIAAWTSLSLEAVKTALVVIQRALLVHQEDRGRCRTARHGAAHHVSVALRRDAGGWIEARIGDDGQGFDVEPRAEPRAGLGLRSMRERARLLGGDLTITSDSGRGTMVCVRLPLNGTVAS